MAASVKATVTSNDNANCSRSIGESDVTVSDNRKCVVLDQTSSSGRTFCPLCGRQFASTKYLVMHQMALHRRCDGTMAETVAATVPAVSDNAVKTRMQRCITRHSSHALSPYAADATAAVDFRLSASSETSTSRHWAVKTSHAVERRQSIETTTVGRTTSSVSCVSQVQQSNRSLADNDDSTNLSSRRDSAKLICSKYGPGQFRSVEVRQRTVNAERRKMQSDSCPVCPVCHKRLSHKSSLRNHQRTHTGQRPYVCEICSIGFKERYHLKKHALYKHSDEMREQCRQCGKRFKDSTAVRAHTRIHSDTRPYSCSRCGKSFKTTECLWHHAHRSRPCDVNIRVRRTDSVTTGRLDSASARRIIDRAGRSPASTRCGKLVSTMHSGLLLLADSAMQRQSYCDGVITTKSENFSTKTAYEENKSTVFPDDVEVKSSPHSESFLTATFEYGVEDMAHRPVER